MKRRSGSGWRWWWRGVAPDAHTPTPTNYHCVFENKEEVKIEAPWTEMSQFVRLSPQRCEGGEKGEEGQYRWQVTSSMSPSGKLYPHCLFRATTGACLVPVRTQLCKVR